MGGFLIMTVVALAVVHRVPLHSSGCSSLSNGVRLGGLFVGVHSARVLLLENECRGEKIEGKVRMTRHELRERKDE